MAQKSDCEGRRSVHAEDQSGQGEAAMVFGAGARPGTVATQTNALFSPRVGSRLRQAAPVRGRLC